MIRDSTKSRVLLSLSSFVPRSQYVISGMSGCSNSTKYSVLLELERKGKVEREKMENPRTRVSVDGWRRVVRNGNGADQKKITCDHNEKGGMEQ